MPRMFAAALLASAVLSACAPLGRDYPQGVGFTGVSHEPGAAALSVAPRAFSPPRAVVVSSTPIPRAPLIRARTKSARQSVQAEAAIRAGGSLDRNSTGVIIAGEPLRLSIVDAGDTRFAVLKKRQRVFDGTMSARAAGEFRSQIPTLTGCQPGPGGYAYGPARGAAVGIAIPLLCS